MRNINSNRPGNSPAARAHAIKQSILHRLRALGECDADAEEVATRIAAVIQSKDHVKIYLVGDEVAFDFIIPENRDISDLEVLTENPPPTLTRGDNNQVVITKPLATKDTTMNVTTQDNAQLNQTINGMQAESELFLQMTQAFLTEAMGMSADQAITLAQPLHDVTKCTTPAAHEGKTVDERTAAYMAGLKKFKSMWDARGFEMLGQRIADERKAEAAAASPLKKVEVKTETKIETVKEPMTTLEKSILTVAGIGIVGGSAYWGYNKFIANRNHAETAPVPALAAAAARRLFGR